MSDSNVSPRQFAAIKNSIKLGRTLQGDLDREITELYRAGKTMSQIADDLGIELNYGVGGHVALSGVRFAIAGHEKSFGGLECYEGLIPDEEEREKLAREHRLKASREVGKITGPQTYRNGTGLHGITAEERRKINTKAGNSTYERGVGIHARTTEQRMELGHEAGTRSAIARGMKPWNEEEKKMAYEISQEPYFLTLRGSDMTSVAQALNGLYHDGQEVRKASSVSSAIGRYKRKLKSKAQNPE